MQIRINTKIKGRLRKSHSNVKLDLGLKLKLSNYLRAT